MAFSQVHASTGLTPQLHNSPSGTLFSSPARSQVQEPAGRAPTTPTPGAHNLIFALGPAACTLERFLLATCTFGLGCADTIHLRRIPTFLSTAS